MFIHELNDKLAGHQIFLQIVACNKNSSKPERFRLLKVERNATQRLHITVQSEVSKDSSQFRLVNEQEHRDFSVTPQWVLVYEDPMTGDLAHAARPQLYCVNGLIAAHLDD